MSTANPDGELIALGERFEKFLLKYMDAWLEWAPLMRAARAEVGDDIAMLTTAIKRTGCEAAQARMSELERDMQPLAEKIMAASATSLGGLRAKALVALWEALPAHAFHHGAFEFRDDGEASRSLFDAVAVMTGLMPLVRELEARARGRCGVLGRRRIAATRSALGNEAAQPEDFAEQGQGATHSWLDRRSASRFGGWASAASFIGNIPEHYDSGLGPIIFVDYAADVARRAEACGPARVPETAAGTGIVTRKLRGQRRRKTLAEDPGSTRPELRIPSGAAQTRVVSVASIRLDSRKSMRSFKGIICADISEFESHMPSQPAGLYGPCPGREDTRDILAS